MRRPWMHDQLRLRHHSGQPLPCSERRQHVAVAVLQQHRTVQFVNTGTQVGVTQDFQTVLECSQGRLAVAEQVMAELAYERSGPERYLSCHPLLTELVRAVRAHFPGLDEAEYEAQLKERIEAGEAWVFRAGEEISAALLYSKARRELDFLAVAPECRRRGLAQNLNGLALENLKNLGCAFHSERSTDLLE